MMRRKTLVGLAVLITALGGCPGDDGRLYPGACEIAVDKGDNGVIDSVEIRTYDDDPAGLPAPPYFYHFAIQHNNDLDSRLRMATISSPTSFAASEPKTYRTLGRFMRSRHGGWAWPGRNKTPAAADRNHMRRASPRPRRGEARMLAGALLDV